MDAKRFDTLTRAWSTRRSRRTALGLLATLGVTGSMREDAAAACLADGERCGGDRGTCCSGVCKRKRGSRKKFCQPASGQGTCTIERNYAMDWTCTCEFDLCHCENSEAAVGCNDDAQCTCFVTTRGASFCGDNTGESQFCNENADCVRKIGEGATCVRYTTTSNRCAAPCPTQL